ITSKRGLIRGLTSICVIWRNSLAAKIVRLLSESRPGSAKGRRVDKGNLRLFSGKQLRNSEDLQLRYLTVIGGVVETCLGRFHLHRPGGWCERHKDADFGLLAVDHMGQIADHGD